MHYQENEKKKPQTEKICAKHIHYKGLLSKINKEHLNSTVRIRN